MKEKPAEVNPHHIYRACIDKYVERMVREPTTLAPTQKTATQIRHWWNSVGEVFEPHIEEKHKTTFRNALANVEFIYKLKTKSADPASVAHDDIRRLLEIQNKVNEQRKEVVKSRKRKEGPTQFLKFTDAVLGERKKMGNELAKLEVYSLAERKAMTEPRFLDHTIQDIVTAIISPHMSRELNNAWNHAMMTAVKEGEMTANTIAFLNGTLVKGPGEKK